jgi:predicted nucleic acid-binding protein
VTSRHPLNPSRGSPTLGGVNRVRKQGGSFVDTNILVYAEDKDADRKHGQAVELIRSLWERGDGVLSVQVLQEFFVTVTKKLKKPVKIENAAKIVEQYLTWHVVENTGGLLLAAIRRMGTHRLSFWDALVVEAAIGAGCEVLYSEDLAEGQRFGQVQVVNPFRGETRPIS